MRYKCNKLTEKGITLIALIITIIILLILAGVSISILGDNGLFSQTKNAVERTEKASALENTQLILLEWQSKKILDDTDFKSFLQEKFDSVKNNGDGTYTVSLDGYTVIVNENGEIIGDIQKEELKETAIYAVLYEDGTLAFANDNTKIEGKIISKEYDVNIQEITDTSLLPWKEDSANITTVNFINEIIPTNTSTWFEYFTNLTNIDNIKNLNTSKVTNMRGMFAGCQSLNSLDVSNFDTSNVIDMYGMFWNCQSLNSLDASNFNTSNVRNMDLMFSLCQNLTSLNINNFNTSNVTNMNSMFFNCKNLTSIDISDFNTSNVEQMNAMFNMCSNLKEIYANKETFIIPDDTSIFVDCGTNVLISKSDNTLFGYKINKGSGWSGTMTISRTVNNTRASNISLMHLDPTKTYTVKMNNSNYYFGIQATDELSNRIYDSGWLAPGSKQINDLEYIALNFKYQSAGNTTITDDMLAQIIDGLVIEVNT